MKITTNTISKLFLELLRYMFGGADTWMKSLLILMLLDVITGIVKAMLGKSEKSSKGYLDSAIMWQGGLKKLLTLTIICVSTIINYVTFPDTTVIRTATISYYVATEALSILENASVCGLPLPKSLKNVLEKIKNENNEKNI